MIETDIVIGIYSTHGETGRASASLQSAGISLANVSIASKDAHPNGQAVYGYNTGEKIQHWANRGVFWAEFRSLLFESTMFAIPGFGAILVAGPLTAAIENSLACGRQHSLNAFGAALVSAGVPKQSVFRYETALKNDKFLLLVQGRVDEVSTARTIIADAGYHTSYTVHAERVMIR